MTQSNSHADALTEERRQALGEALTEYFATLDSDAGIRAQNGRILRTFDYCDSRNIDDLIDRAIVPALTVSPVEQPAAAPDGAEPPRHIVDAAMEVARHQYRHGVTRASIIAIWVALGKPWYAVATSANETGVEGADEPYQVIVDVRDLFTFLRAAWREGQHHDREDVPDQANSWSAASDYANKTIERWTSMRPIVPRSPAMAEEAAAGLAHELWAAAQIHPRNGDGIEDAVRRITAILTRSPAMAAAAPADERAALESIREYGRANEDMWLVDKCNAALNDRAAASPAAEAVAIPVEWDQDAAIEALSDFPRGSIWYEFLEEVGFDPTSGPTYVLTVQGRAMLDQLKSAYFAAPQPAQADAPAEAREPARHEWDATGERCVKCGDKDWFADPHCSESRIKGGAPADAGEAREPHSDDVAVDSFAAVMKHKLALARDKGRGGWETCSPADLSRMLREHVEKGDPRDVANFCMMLWHHGSPIVIASPAARVESLTANQRSAIKQAQQLAGAMGYPGVESILGALLNGADQ
ncbi:hypothetical protein WJ41_03190 [Burkholderia ubonensis]|uniref:hypothetical protein n=1 Tax=Burkholderia ubonensis TaxID=101571 RepID=UPI0007525135|nr:hypothetical protein [Burkholderia ubonensis]KVH78408.1 hypothetical protein WJ41_03190 [Burkholderia ubonensis]KVU09879.1 hypothetical protein WK61_24170 [Burkholderia ubonensis]KVU10033.1 hypothetical protein WK61_24995 [Burkholderia ubonensis]